MSASAAQAKNKIKARELPATTVEGLLDQEEARALLGLAEALQRAGQGLAEGADLRARIRSHPFLATGLSACAGFVGGPLLLRACSRLLRTTAAGTVASTGRPRALPALALAALRVARARR